MIGNAAILAKLDAVKDACRTLPFSDPPIPGESLTGLVVRNVAKHGVDKVVTALRVAGLGAGTPEALPVMHPSHAAGVARLLMTSQEEIEARMYPPVDVHGHADAFFNFFRTPVRHVYREVDCRRVSPLSLRVSDHHRAIWSLRVFSFCPESREPLIAACPACGKRLGWRWTLGVSFCESCGADLRAYPQSPIATEDDCALDFVVGLVHPDMARKDRARRMLTNALARFDNGDLFEFAVALAEVLIKPDNARRYVARLHSAKHFDRLTPDILAKAGRFILDWPTSFHAHSDTMRETARERGGHWGVAKEIGAVEALARDPFLAPALRAEIATQIHANLRSAPVTLRRAETRIDNGLVTVRAAYEMFGIHYRFLTKWARAGLIKAEFDPDAKRSIFLVDPQEIAQIKRQAEDCMSALEVRKVLGVDPLSVDALANQGRLVKLHPAVGVRVNGDAYSRKSVEALLRSIVSAATQETDGSRAVRLVDAADALAVAPFPWAGLLAAILEGRLVVRLGADDGPLTCRLLVQSDDAFAALVDEFSSTHVDAPASMTTHEAAAFLGTTEIAIASFIRDGLIAVNGARERKLDRAAVEGFRRECILLNEIVRRTGMKANAVKPFLRKKSVVAINHGAAKHFVWRRGAVEAAMGDQIK